MTEFDYNDERRLTTAQKYPIYERRACGHWNDGYNCTREYGHVDKHVAHISESEVCAVWEKENDPS